MKATSGFSADTEILTRHSGWVTFDRLTYLDEVATRSPEGRFEWQIPERITWQRYDGGMVWLHSRTTDLMVLPGTTILYLERHRARRNGQSIELPYTEKTTVAHDVISRRLPLIATSRWEPPRPAYQIELRAKQIKHGRGLDFTASADDFAAFMGMYLAEGNLCSDSHPGYYISIWQKAAGRGFCEYQDLLNRLMNRKVPHAAAKGYWCFSHKALYTFLKDCGRYAWTKRIPDEVLGLSQASLDKFWQYYSLGDGTIMTAPGRKNLDVISTTSKDMADRFQEVLQKLGGWGLIQIVDYRKYSNASGINAARLTYRLVRRAGAVAFASAIESVPYAGLIGTVQVTAPAVYVRRNNRPVWSGT